MAEEHAGKVRNHLHQMCLDHFNEPMIVGGEVVRCIGYAEDDSDCYIMCQRPGGERTYMTCVGGYTFLDRLAGQNQVTAYNGEIWDDLTRLDSALTRAGAPRAESFTVAELPNG